MGWSRVLRYPHCTERERERESGKRVLNLEIQDLFTKITRRKETTSTSSPRCTLLCKNLWLKITLNAFTCFTYSSSYTTAYALVIKTLGEKMIGWAALNNETARFPLASPLYSQNPLAEEQTKNSNFSIQIHENHLFRPNSAVLIETRLVGQQLGAFSPTQLQSHTHSCTFKAVNLKNYDDHDAGQGKEQ